MAGLGEVKVTLGLDTTAAQQQLKKFFGQFGEPVKDPLKAVDKSLDSTVKKAKDLGFEWDKTTKTFKSSQGFTQTLGQMKSTLSATSKAAKESGVSFKTMGNIVKTSGEQYKMITGGMEQARAKMQGLGTQAKATATELKGVSNGSVSSGLNQVGQAAKNASTGFDALGNEATAAGQTMKGIGQVATQDLIRLGDIADGTTGDINELGNASQSVVGKLKSIGSGGGQGLQKLGTDAKNAGTGITALGTAATDTGQDLIKIYNGGKGLAQLSTNAKNLGTAFTQASTGTRALGTSMKNLGNAAPGIKNLGNSVTGMATSTKSAATGFGQLGAALQRANQQAQPLTALPQKIKPINSALTSAGTAAQGAGQKFAQSGTAMKGFTNTVNEGFKQMLIGIPQGIGMAIGNALIAPLKELANVVPAAVNEFKALDESLRLTLEISGAGAAKFGELKEAILGVSSVTAATATDIGAIAQSLSKAGFSLDEVKVAMKPIAQAAEATGTAYDTMGDIVVSALGQFKLAAEDAGMVADALVVAANSSNQSVTDLGEAFKYVGPVAAGLGNSIEDVSVALGVLANAGIKGSSAGTALRTTMSNLAIASGNADAEFMKLSRGSGRIANALKLVQAQMLDANGELKTGTDFIYALKDAMESLPQQEKALVAKALAGTEGLSAMNALISASSDEIDGLADSLANAAGAAESQAGKALAGLSGQLKLLESNISSALVTIGEVVATVLTPVITTIRTILEAFNALPGPIKSAAVALGLLGGAIGVAAVAMTAFTAATKTAFGAELIANITNFTKAINAQTLATSINGMVTGFRNMTQVLTGGLTKGLQAATKGMKAFTDAVKGGTLFSGIADGVKGLGASFQAMIKPAQAAQLSLNLAAAGGTNLGTAAAAGATGTTALGGAAAGAAGGIGGLTTALGSFLVTIAPIALAIGGIVLAVKAVSDYMGKWNEAQKPLKASTKLLTDEIEDQGLSFDGLLNSMDPMGGILESMAGGYDNWGKSIEDALGPVDRLLSLMGPLWSAFKFGAELIGRFDGWLKQKTQVAALNEEHGKFKSAMDKTNAEIEENTQKMAKLNPLSEEYGKLAKRNAELSQTQVRATEARVAAIDKQIEALMKNEKHNKLVIDKLKDHKAELQAGLAIQQANADALKSQYTEYLNVAGGINDYTAALDAANQKRKQAEAERDAGAWADELLLVNKLKEGVISEAEAGAAAAKSKLARTDKVLKSYENELQAIEDLYSGGQMKASEYEKKTSEINAKVEEVLKNRIDEEKALTEAVEAAVADRLDSYMEEVNRMQEAYSKVYDMLNSLTTIGSGGISAFKSLADAITSYRLQGIEKVKNEEMKGIDSAAKAESKVAEANHKRRLAMIDASGASDERKNKMRDAAEKQYQNGREAAEESYQAKREAAERKAAEEKKRIMQEQIKFEETAHQMNMKLKELELELWREQQTIQNQIAQQEIKVTALKRKAAGASAEELKAYDDALGLLKTQGELIDTQYKLKKKVLDVQGRVTEAGIAQKAAANDVNSEYSNSLGSITALEGEMRSFAGETEAAIKKVQGIKDGLDPIPDRAQEVFDETMRNIDTALGKADFKTLKAELEKQVGPRQAELLARKLTEAYDKEGTVAADKFAKNFLDRFGTAGTIPKNWIADQLKVALQQANGVTEKEAQAIFDGMENAIPVDQIAKVLGKSVGGGYEEGLVILKNTPLPGMTLGAEQLTSQFSGAISQGAEQGAQEAAAPLQNVGGAMLKGVVDTFLPGLTTVVPQIGTWATNTGSQAGAALAEGITTATQGAFEPLGQAAADIGPTLAQGLQATVPQLSGIGTQLGQEFERWGMVGGQEFGEALVRDVGNFAGDVVQTAGDIINPGMYLVTEGVKNDWLGIGTFAGNVFGEETVNSLLGFTDEVQSTVVNFFSDGNEIENRAREIGDSAATAIGDGLQSLDPVVDATANNVADRFGNMIPKDVIKDELIASLAINTGTDLARAEEAFNQLPSLIPREEVARELGMEAIGGGVEMGQLLMEELTFGPDGQARLSNEVNAGIEGGVQKGQEGIEQAGQTAGTSYGRGISEGVEREGKAGFEKIKGDAEAQGEGAATKFVGPMKKKADEMRKAFETEFKAISKQFNTAFKEANFDELADGLREAVVEPVSEAVEELEKLRAPGSLNESFTAVGEAAEKVGSSGMAEEVKASADASRPLKANMSAAKNSISSAVGPARALAGQLERAARAAERAARARFAGGPVQSGQTYTVNEFGKEMFQSSSGQISEIKAPAFGQWRAPSSGTVIPAHIANEIRAQKEASQSAMNMQQMSGGTTTRTSNRTAHAGGPNYQKQMVKELKNLANSGGTTTNNIQIQSQAPVRDASHILVQANRLRNLRKRR